MIDFNLRHCGRARCARAGAMLARRPLRQRLIALACIGWVTACEGFRLAPDPLALGMTPQAAATSLRSNLTYVSGPPGAEIYVVDRLSEIAGFGRVAERTFLQFRRGVLLGWTSGWRVPPAQ